MRISKTTLTPVIPFSALLIFFSSQVAADCVRLSEADARAAQAALVKDSVVTEHCAVCAGGRQPFTTRTAQRVHEVEIVRRDTDGKYSLVIDGNTVDASQMYFAAPQGGGKLSANFTHLGSVLPQCKDSPGASQNPKNLDLNVQVYDDAVQALVASAHSKVAIAAECKTAPEKNLSNRERLDLLNAADEALNPSKTPLASKIRQRPEQVLGPSFVKAREVLTSRRAQGSNFCAILGEPLPTDQLSQVVTQKILDGLNAGDVISGGKSELAPDISAVDSRAAYAKLERASSPCELSFTASSAPRTIGGALLSPEELSQSWVVVRNEAARRISNTGGDLDPANAAAFSWCKDYDNAGGQADLAVARMAARCRQLTRKAHDTNLMPAFVELRPASDPNSPIRLRAWANTPLEGAQCLGRIGFEKLVTPEAKQADHPADAAILH